MSEEKHLYRIKAQTSENNNGITVTATTSNEVTHDEAVIIAKSDVLLEPVEIRYSNFLVEKIGTEEQWRDGHILFCPRCGENLSEFELYSDNNFDCPHCEAQMDIHITVFNESD